MKHSHRLKDKFQFLYAFGGQVCPPPSYRNRNLFVKRCISSFHKSCYSLSLFWYDAQPVFAQPEQEPLQPESDFSLSLLSIFVLTTYSHIATSSTIAPPITFILFSILKHLNYAIPSSIPIIRTINATIHAIAHCNITTCNAAFLVPISRLTEAIAATQGV